MDEGPESRRSGLSVEVDRAGPERLIEEVLPALAARLVASRLAEIEVRSEDWRIRLRRPMTSAVSAPPPTGHRGMGGGPEPAAGADTDGRLARSPAVGYFSPAAELVVGGSVRAGDPIGRVDVLGVAHEVSSPVDGVIGRVLVEPGQAVEYGEPLALVEPGLAAGGARPPIAPGDAPAVDG